VSIEALTWAKQVKAGDGSRKAVLFVLANYADEEGSCFPSQARIAEEAEVCERTVRTYLAEFEERGLIRRERRVNECGHRTSDRIYLALSEDGPLPASDAGEPPASVAGDAVPTGKSFAGDLPATVAGRTPPTGKSFAGGLPANDDSPTGKSFAGEPKDKNLKIRALTSSGCSASPTDVAKRILNDWWETQNPRPTQPYVAILKILRKALANGWTEAELRQALDDVPVVSGAALDLWRKNNTRRVNAQAERPAWARWLA